jgi:hypothetical protein
MPVVGKTDAKSVAFRLGVKRIGKHLSSARVATFSRTVVASKKGFVAKGFGRIIPTILLSKSCGLERSPVR